MTSNTYHAALDQLAELVDDLILGSALNNAQYARARERWQHMQATPEDHWMELQVLTTIQTDMKWTPSQIQQLNHIQSTGPLTDQQLQLLNLCSQRIEREQSRTRARIGR